MQVCGDAMRIAAMDGTVLCAANHVPLTPISFLERAAVMNK